MQDTVINLLVVEDNPGDLLLIEEMLSEIEGGRMRPVHAASLAQAREVLAGGGIDVVLLDLSLPDSHGMETLRRVLGDLGDAPVVVMTGLDDSSVALEAVSEGAQDYLVKGRFNARGLSRAVQYAIERKRLERELFVTSARLESLMQSLPLVVYALSPDKNFAFTYVSDYMERLLGAGAEEVLENPDFLRERIHPDDAGRTALVRVDILKRGFSAWQYRLRNNKGEYRWIQDECRLVKDQTGNPLEIIGYWADITDQKQAEDKIRHMALHDQLTGLPNRWLLADRLEQALERGRRFRQKVALLFVDIDGFKPINDSYGHEKGDQVLVMAGDCLAGSMRKVDTVARMGGDEFVVVLQDILKPGDVALVAEKIVRNLRSLEVVPGGGLRIGASVGVSVFPGDGLDVDTLLTQADNAMYGAKKAGGNTFCFAGHDPGVAPETLPDPDPAGG